MLGLILLLILILYSTYCLLSLNFTYWKRRGVPTPAYSIFFGNIKESLSMKKSLGQVYNDIYKEFSDYLYVGFYKIRQPGLLIRDPSLIRNILVRDFNNFHDNDIIIDEKTDPIGGRNPFVLKGEKWKVAKNQLTPCFTPKRLKAMFPLVEEASRKLVRYLENEPDATNSNGLEAKELSAKYTTEVVATCAFGLEGKSFEEPNSEFRQMGKKIFNPSLGTTIKMLLLFLIPSLSKVLKVAFWPEEVACYFRKIIQAALEYRKRNKIVRNDFLDIMKELRDKVEEFTDEDILAHALGFFTDGFETSASVLSFLLYELAINLDVQDRLHEEVQKKLEEVGGKLDYDDINGMQYLDAVVHETLRMHPPGMVLFRMCTNPTTFPPPRGEGTGPDLRVEQNTPIIIPVYALHNDPTYFSNPEKFDPNRFINNQDPKLKTVYMPFGEGPRNCHGQRFGVLQIKLAVVAVLQRFQLELNANTITPLEMNPKCLLPEPVGGIWVNFQKRN